jgi:uncharacterized ubiquitin-like protein YukD
MKNIKVNIILAWRGSEYNVEVPINYTGYEVIKGLMEGLKLPSMDQGGNPISYELVIKETEKYLTSETIKDAGIKDGSILILMTAIIAG